MTKISLLLLLVVLLSPALALLSVEETEVEVIGNPHARRTKSDDEPTGTCQTGCQPRLLLSPHRIIRSRSFITQPDTLIGIETKKVLGVPVPLYQFRQPARLSPAQLPFKLILVGDIDIKAGLAEVPIDHAAASDSWFPGYLWSPVVCSACGEHVHVGWKFSSDPADPSADFFYALIVEATERRRAGGGIAVGALGDMVAEAVEVGVRAPGWMVSALAKAV